MRPKYFIVCTEEQLAALVDVPNPLDYAFWHDMPIVDEDNPEYVRLEKERNNFIHMTPEEWMKR